MVVKIQVIREDRIVAEISKEVTDTVLPLERQRQYQLEETIRDFIPEVVSSVIKDYENSKN